VATSRRQPPHRSGFGTWAPAAQLSVRSVRRTQERYKTLSLPKAGTILRVSAHRLRVRTAVDDIARVAAAHVTPDVARCLQESDVARIDVPLPNPPRWEVGTDSFASRVAAEIQGLLRDRALPDLKEITVRVMLTYRSRAKACLLERVQASTRRSFIVADVHVHARLVTQWVDMWTDRELQVEWPADAHDEYQGVKRELVTDTNLTKVYVDLPQHWATGGESLWAKVMGDGLYEIDNIPFYAYGINCRDVVRAIAKQADQKPQVEEVVRSGGHKTLRFFFAKDLAVDAQQDTLDSLRLLHVSFERADERYIAVDVPPSVDYAAVCSALAALEGSGLLEYETCEIRVAGRFDLDGTAHESDA
jgi:hypothetical protein